MSAVKGAQCTKVTSTGFTQIVGAGNGRPKLVGFQAIGGTSVVAIAYAGTDATGRMLGEHKQATLVPVKFDEGQEPQCPEGIGVAVTGTSPEVLVWYID